MMTYCLENKDAKMIRTKNGGLMLLYVKIKCQDL